MRSAKALALAAGHPWTCQRLCVAALCLSACLPAWSQTPAEATSRQEALERLQRQIDRRIEEFQERPRKKFIGAIASEYRFAKYEEEWREKIERVGTVNFPTGLYGTVRVTVSIGRDGSLEAAHIDRSSGNEALDRAVLRIVRLASPFEAFPPEISRDTDLLVITRTWRFVQGESAAW